MLSLYPVVLAAVASTLLACGPVTAAPFPPTEVATSSLERPPTEFPKPKRQKKLAFYSSDGKVDDNLAMALGAKMEHYDEAHIFHDGVGRQEASAINTEFLQQCLESQGKPGSLTQRYHYEGASPFLDREGNTAVMDHEHHFIDPNVLYGQHVMEHPTLHTAEDLDDNLSQYRGSRRRADFFSQAPVPGSVLEPRIAALRKNGIKLDNFHHILGYNTRQDSVSKIEASDETQAFAEGLHNMVKSYYPNARVIFTNSYHNLEGPPGATQDYDRLEGILPEFASSQIGEKDTFFGNQMRAVYNALAKKHLDPVPFLGSDNNFIQQPEIWRARQNKPGDELGQRLRDGLLEAALINRSKLQEGSNLASRMNSVIGGLLGPCQGEACDFNHQALVHAAIHKAQTDPDAEAFQPVTLKGNIRMDSAKPGEYQHAVSPNPKLFTKHTASEFLRHYMESPGGQDQTGGSGSSSSSAQY